MERGSLGEWWAFGRPHQPFVTPRKRRFSGVAAMVTVLLTLAIFPAFADGIEGDADTLATAPPTENGLSADQTIGGPAVLYDYSAVVKNTGNATNDVFKLSGDKVNAAVTFTQSEAWTASVDTQFTDSAGNAFTTYEQNKAGKLSVTVPNSATAGDVNHINVTITATATNGQSLSPSKVELNYTITARAPSAPANTAPTVAFSSPPSSANEGTATTFNYTITDPDANTWTTVAGFPSCGAGNTVSNATLVGKSGSFQCTFVDGVVPAQSVFVSVQVSDGTANSNVATASVTVNNVDPTVAIPVFSVGTADCRVQVTLTNISFSDPGVNDGPWAVAIDWNDPNDTTDTTFNASSQGAQSNHTHTYDTPGTYNATVTVTDKDGGAGSNTTTTALTVTQEYTVTFLQPFDQSTLTKYVINKAKAGRTVPVKVQIYDVCAQAAYADPSAAPRVAVNTSNTSGATSDAIEAYADAGTSNNGDMYFRWSTDGFWIYNLDTRTILNGGPLVIGNTYRVDVWVTSLAGVKATDDEFALLQSVK